jgi:predicted RNA-binding Zn ribbon-like protein
MSTTSTSPVVQEPLPIMLANTISVDRGRVRDRLERGADLKRWVRTIGGQMDLSPRPSSIEAIAAPAAERLISLRDGIRRLAVEHTMDPRTLGQSVVPDVTAAMTIINSASAVSSVWPELEWDDSTARRRDVWAGGDYVDAFIAVIARQTIDLSISPQWDRLRPCLAPGCAYFFVKDHVRRQWCAPHCGASHVTRSATEANEGGG